MQTLGKRKPSPCSTNCCLAASVLNPVADTSSSLLGKWLNAIWHRVLGRNAGISTHHPLLSGGKLLPSSALLRTQTDAMQRWKAAGTELGNKSAWGRRVSMTHPVQPPNTILQSNIPANYSVRSQLDVEAVTWVTQYSSGDWVTAVKGTKSNSNNSGICYLLIASSSFLNVSVYALVSLLSSLS